MNRDQIDELMRENGIVVAGEAVYALVQLVIKRQLDECAELVLQGTGDPVQTKTLDILRKERERIAAAIRAKGV
jgi:hypothetical protein